MSGDGLGGAPPVERSRLRVITAKGGMPNMQVVLQGMMQTMQEQMRRQTQPNPRSGQSGP